MSRAPPAARFRGDGQVLTADSFVVVGHTSLQFVLHGRPEWRYRGIELLLFRCRSEYMLLELGLGAFLVAR